MGFQQSFDELWSDVMNTVLNWFSDKLRKERSLFSIKVNQIFKCVVKKCFKTFDFGEDFLR